MTERDAAWELAAAHHRAAMDVEQVRKLRRRAGRAVDRRADVEQELSDAIDVFAVADWSNLNLESIARAAGRVQRLARSLQAADDLPGALRAARRTSEDLERLRETIKRRSAA